jgi:hypothetical protein
MLPPADVLHLAHITLLRHCRKWHTGVAELMVRDKI